MSARRHTAAAGDALVVGVDLGTTGAKAALYDLGGRVLGEAMVDTPLHWRGRGHVEQDPDDFVKGATDAIAACVRQAAADPADVRAVGISGQMAGILGVGADGRPATPYDSWLDTRCAPDVEWLERELGDELAATTGCPPMVNHAPKLRWRRREDPDGFGATAAWVTPSGYVAGRLAGVGAGEAFMDTSYLHFTGLADAERATWSERLAGVLGVPVETLPRIVAPTEQVGELAPEAAAACGLAPGTAIAAGLGDTAAGALGAGIVRPGQLLDIAGTAAILAGSSEEFRPDVDDRTLITMRGAVPGQWVSLSYLSGGSLLGWLADLLLGEAAEEHRPERFDTLCALAATAPAGADGLLFLPYLDGRLLPSAPELRASWFGMDRRHGREHLARAVLESVALEYAGYLDVLRARNPELRFDEVRVSGGGARSSTWNAIKASVLGVPYQTLGRSELGCWGAALVAAASAGLVDDLAAAATAATPPRARFEPDAGEHQEYRRLLPVRDDLVRASAAASRRLGDQPLHLETQKETA